MAGFDLAVVGGGILGLAHAWAGARRGWRVVVLERSPQASGASVRNFGMIWPIGQPPGALHALAMESRRLWLQVLNDARLPYRPTGSLHVTYRADEAAVGREFSELAAAHGYACAWRSAEQVLVASAAVRKEGLLGGLWSPSEVTVDPRRILGELPAYLAERFGVSFHFGTAVRNIRLPAVEAGDHVWEAGRAIVCGGDDFETLYPEHFRASGITRCKLQMLRTVPQPDGWELGPSLAAGLSLRFYGSFRICSTLGALAQRIATEMPEYERWGIHVMASQTAAGEITLGDSHEYGLAPDVFNKAGIDDLIVDYANGFLRIPDPRIAQRWHGVYAKHPEKPYVAIDPAPGVRIVTAAGGAGMTLSFGLAEKMLQEMGGGPVNDPPPGRLT